jgi:hypothetical protein
MIKYLFFQNDSVDTSDGVGYPNDSALMPAERLMGMELNADGTDLTMSFKSMLQSKGVSCQIVLSITADSGADVMAAIAEEIALGNEGFINIADEYNGVFLHSDITAIETTLDGSFQ